VTVKLQSEYWAGRKDTMEGNPLQIDEAGCRFQPTRRSNRIPTKSLSKEESHEFSGMDCCRADSRLACGTSHEGGGYGVLVDIILGILGGFLGGWLFGQLGIWPGGGMIGSIIVAFAGAVILVGITRLIKRA
jgi:uncharacterized membrane protein YeaQ/YmgE (transglycosylase-associated protein family)